MQPLRIVLLGTTARQGPSLQLHVHLARSARRKATITLASAGGVRLGTSAPHPALHPRQGAVLRGGSARLAHHHRHPLDW